MPARTQVNTGRSAQFVAAKTQSISVATNSTIAIGDTDFTLLGWFYLDALTGGNQTLAGKFATTGNQRSYLLQINTTPALNFTMSADGTATGSATHATTLSTGTWYFAAVTYTASTDTISLTLNAANAATGTLANGFFASTAALALGYRTTDATGALNGRLDRFALWKGRALTAGEITTLYNSGLGLAYADLITSQLTSLISWWDLDEVAGIRYDSHTSGNDLAEASGIPVGWNLPVTGAPAPGLMRGNRGVQLKSGSSQYFTAADSASLSASGGSFSACCWVKATSRGGLSRAIMGKYAGAGGREWTLQHTLPNDRFQFVLADGTNPINQPIGTNAGPPVIGEWQFIVVTWSGTQALIYVNNGNPVAGNTPGTVPDTATNFFLGAENASIFWDGLIDGTAYWKGKVLTAAEVRALFNNGMGVRYADLAGITSGSLLTSLSGWWELDEYTGSRVDSSGNANTLTENGGPIFAANGTGQGNLPVTATGDRAARLDGLAQYLSLADNAALSMGVGVQFSLAGWVWLEDMQGGAEANLFAKYNTSGNQREYRLYKAASTNAWTLAVSAAGTAVSLTLTGPAISPGVWNFVALWYDGANLNLSINNGTATTSAYSGDVFDGTSAFQIGALNNPSAFSKARFRTVGVWKKALSSGERTELYSAGLGLRYSQITSTSTLLTSLSAYWNLDEAGGSRLDSVGTSHLTENGGSIGWARGVAGSVVPAVASVDRAARFDNGVTGTQWLSAADATSLRVGGGAFSFAAWVWLESKAVASSPGACGKCSGGGNGQFAYLFDYSRSLDKLRFNWAPVGAQNAINGAFAPSERTWYFLVGTWDGATYQFYTNGAAQTAGTASATAPNDDAGSFQVGRGYASTGQAWNGRVDKIGFWKGKALSTTEVTSLYNGGVGLRYGQLTGSLLTSLNGYWDLDEPSGTRNDSTTNANHLTDSGSVLVPWAMPVWGGRRAALLNGDRSAQFNGTSQYLSIANNASLAHGNFDFTYAGWLYLNSFAPGGATRTFLSKLGNAGNREILAQLSATNAITWITYYDGTNNAQLTSASALTERQWYFVVIAHDSVNDLLKISLNGATYTTGAANAAGVYSAATFDVQLGAASNSGQYYPGRMDKWARWNKVLSAAEITSLYNSGLGLRYADITSGSSLFTSLQAWWDLDEQSGSRTDASGNANTLTDNGSVLWNHSVDGSA